MNGHGKAELLAFRIAEISRRWGRSIGDVDDSPVFILAAGRASGERELQRRLARTMEDEPALDATVISAMSHQLLRAASYWDKGPAAEASPSARGVETLRGLVRAQAAFLRGVSRAAGGEGRPSAWGMTSTDITGDHALYLRLLFPRARFIFLHRNPIDAFAAALRSTRNPAAADGRDLSWAAGFAEQWCRLVASFELWHKEVDGILVGYEQAMAASPGQIEAYLGERLSPPVSAPEPENGANSAAQLRADEVKLLVERTGEMAARLGYTLTAEVARAGQGSAEPEPALGTPQVHTESVRISCAVLVPAMRYIEPECEEALHELEIRGYAVRRMRGASPVDHARSRLATSALDEGFEETLWIDADTAFDPDAVEQLRSHNVPMVAGIYPRRGPRAGLAVAPVPGTAELVMGDGGGLVEVLYAGAGFLLVRREVYAAIQQR
ncbi:MAG: hypothetical protein B7Z73_11895, partial [Planctomycetia bacterium 21-64-5]